MAQPPFLENGGEWARLATNPIPRFKASQTVANLKFLKAD
jgi:hypothetical protein